MEENTFIGFSGDNTFTSTDADTDQNLVDDTILCGIIVVFMINEVINMYEKDLMAY